MKTLIFDLETNGLLPTMDRIWSMGVSDPETGIIDVYTDYSDAYPSLREGIDRLKEADRVVAHNLIGFDYPALEMFYPGEIKYEQLWDSLVVGALLEPERKQHSIKSYGNEFGAPKGDHTDWLNYSQEMVDYMIRDVEILTRLYNKLISIIDNDTKLHGLDWNKAINLEHKVVWCLSLQERHGFKIDLDKANHLDSLLRQEAILLERELQEIFPPQVIPDKGVWDWSERRWIDVEIKDPKVNRRPQGVTKGCKYTKCVTEQFNPSSRPQIVRRLSAKYLDWKPNAFTPGGMPQIDETVLSNMKYPEALALKRFFRVNKQLGQLADGKNSWLKLERDGRVHGRVKSVGARTHRMSHFYPNMAQVDAKDKRMREVWIPDDGHKLVGCDASALELRMLAHYVAIWDKGKYAESVIHGKQSDGTDVHTRTQKIAGLYSRNSAKTLTYAFLYGAGNEMLSRVMCEDAKAAGQPIPKGKGYKLGKATRDKLETGIVGLGNLVKVSQQRDKSQGWLKGLDGRKVYTNGQHSALNTLLQSAGAIVMKEALSLLHFDIGVERGLVDKKFQPIGWNYVANVHDEIQLTADPLIAEKLGQAMSDAIKAAGKSLGLRCPQQGEYMIGNSWADTH